MKSRVLNVLLALLFCLSLFIISSPAANNVDSGTCGKDVTWSLESDGMLTIRGTGEMDDFDEETNVAPWNRCRTTVSLAIIEDGVTSIGEYAFSDLPSNCQVVFTGNLPSISDKAFRYSYGINAFYPQDNKTWTESAMRDYGGELRWAPYSKECDYLGHDFDEGVITTQETCEKSAIITYTCKRCHETNSIAGRPVLGHQWIYKPYEWADDYSEVTATRICTNGEGHEETETAKATVIAYSSPTCTEQGSKTYEFRFKNKAFIVPTRIVRIPALDHDWGEWTTIKEPTSTETGVAIRTCKRDSTHVETKSLPIIKSPEKPSVTPTPTTKPTETPSSPSSPTSPTPISNPFTDVIQGKFYYDAVLWAVGHDPQITKGTSETTFGPEEGCTRGQVVTFLWRAMGCPEPTSNACPFTDVKTNGFYYKAMLWAVEQGITKGTTETTFEPDATCTRGQIVTFLYRLHDSPAVSGSNPFEDVPEKAFCYKAVLWAVANDITKGTAPTQFSPDDTCTRGQIVTFLYRDLA